MFLGMQWWFWLLLLLLFALIGVYFYVRNKKPEDE